MSKPQLISIEERKKMTWQCNCVTKAGRRCLRLKRHPSGNYCGTHWRQLLRAEEEQVANKSQPT